MRKCNLCKKVILVSGLTLTMLMTACSGSEKPGDMLIGSWVSEYNDIVTFEKDGRCTAPFTYNASWWESADHYTVKEDGRNESSRRMEEGTLCYRSSIFAGCKKI